MLHSDRYNASDLNLPTDALARYGTKNPEKVNNAFYQYMVRNPSESAWAGTKIFNFESDKPVYSFQRFMRAVIDLEDGRRILVGGEHEDWYDPDFFIYNDIVVSNPNGSIDIYFYPFDIFHPIEDANLKERDGQLIISGGKQYIPNFDYENMSYIDVTSKRYMLDLKTFKINSF